MANNGDGMIDVAVLVALVMGAANANRLQPVIQHNSELTGDKYFREIMATENVHRFREVARMDKETFVKFIAPLCDIGGLHNSMYMHRANGNDILSGTKRPYKSHHLRALAT